MTVDVHWMVHLMEKRRELEDLQRAQIKKLKSKRRAKTDEDTLNRNIHVSDNGRRLS